MNGGPADAGEGGFARAGNDGEGASQIPVMATDSPLGVTEGTDGKVRGAGAFATRTSKIERSCRALDRGSHYIVTAQLDQPQSQEMTITIEYCTV